MAAKGKTNGSSFPAWDATKIWTNLNWSNLDVASVIKAQQKKYGNINTWDTSLITDMKMLFINYVL